MIVYGLGYRLYAKCPSQAYSHVVLLSCPTAYICTDLENVS